MAYSQYRKHIQQSRRRSLNPYTPLPPIGSTTAEQDNSSCDEQIDDDVQSREHTEHDNNDEHAADDDNDESDSDSDDSPMMTFSDLLGMIEEHVSSELLDKADEIFWEIWRQICNHTDVIVRKIDMNQLDLKDVQVELSRHIEDLWDTNDMSDVDSCYNLLYIKQLTENCSHSNDAGKKVGTLLASLKYVELMHSMWMKTFSEGSFRTEVKDQFVRLSTKLIIGTLWDLSDESVEICEKIIETGFSRDMVKSIATISWTPVLLDDKWCTYVVKAFINILHNVARVSSTSRAPLRSIRTIEALQQYRESKKYKTLAVVSLMAQSYLVAESENTKIQASREQFELLVKLLDGSSSINNIGIDGCTFSTFEVLQALSNLAINDDNKLHIIDCGALPYFVQVFQPQHPADEQLAAIQGIRRLASKFRDRVLQLPGCVEALRELAEQSPNEEIRNQAKETWHFLIDTNSTPVTSNESSRPCDLASAAAATDETNDDKCSLMHNEESEQINE